MSDRGKQILEEALSLPPTERAELAELVLASLPGDLQRGIDEAWAEEAESRLDAYERGDLDAVDADRVLDRIRASREQ